MPQAEPEQLRKIRSFPQLVKYLRDELDWPIETENFEDLTFDYDPDELGIDPKTAAKIEEIKQLRPLTAEQPWGVFFVKFQPKRLPVVALRRILSKLVFRKRESANPAERQTWDKHDLLFISSYGEDDDRQISFAHFTDNDQHGDLPTLRVLGWDRQDAPLRLDRVHQQLHKHLRWPDGDEDAEAWRQRWANAFELRPREVVTTSRALARQLADLARDIRANVNAALQIESDNGPLRTLMGAFKEALIHELDEDGFADMYAQTIAYGLLSARVSRPAGLVADNIAEMVPITNPFLKELMETFLNIGGRRWSEQQGRLIGIDFDELGVNRVVDLLREANMEAVLRDFGNRNPQEDPVLHFYEELLKEYDPQKRLQRGVFYTPKPVVSYIVRSVHELLQTEFGLEDGLADTTTWGQMLEKYPDMQLPEIEVVDPETGQASKKPIDRNTPFVQILDPATGTATFLVEVIDVIYNTMRARWQAEGYGDLWIQRKWNEYVPKHLLPRLHGYELMMAPYAIAHMKIGLKLFETGYTFEEQERARIYLTNALEPPRQFQPTFAVAALAHEADAVNRIKRHQPITAVIGNPPYAGISSNMTEWSDGLLKGTFPDGSSTASYYHVDGEPLGERKIWLQDDYVKFIRWSQYRLENTGTGVHGFITNHGYLDNPTFRGMRWSLMDAFDDLRVLDLHGNLKKKETSPDGGRDVNVFDIQQGVSIGIFMRRPAHQQGIDATSVCHAGLWGEREPKYRWLATHSATNTKWQSISTTEPFFLFEPLDQTEIGSYNKWPSIEDVMHVNVTGIVTARDEFVIDFDRDALIERIADLRDDTFSDQAIRDKYFAGKGSKKYPSGDSRGWKLPEARAKVRKDEDWKERDVPILYRPFDSRQIYYVSWMVDWPRTEAMPHLLAGENLALITTRQQKQSGNWQQVYVTDQMGESTAISNKTSEINYFFPLYLYRNVGKADVSMFCPWPEGKNKRRPNLDPVFVEVVEEATELTFVPDGRGDSSTTFGPEDVLAYIYAIFHCPEYRRRFEAMLKLDFPRVPPPISADSFVALARLGHEALALHLFESRRLNTPIAKYTGPANPEVEKVSYTADDQTVWLDKAQTYGFVGVPEEVWRFHIGAYQVCEKWLKDRQAKGGKNPRPGRKLTDEDIEHYKKIVTALSETIRLMGEVDEAIEQHGGWSEAFITDPEKLEQLKHQAPAPKA